MGDREREFLFGDLVKRHVKLVFSMAQYWCQDRTEAEELTQETFMRAYTKFDHFEVGTNFKAWILTILRHLYLDFQRSRHSKPAMVPLETIGEQEGTDDTSSSFPVVDIDNREIFYDLFSHEIVQFLQRLPKEHQICLLLCDVEDFSYQDIADILGCPVGTVRSRIYRGRQLLQTYIAGYARQVGYLKEENS